MMYPRLKLAKSLLTQDGAVFISIDDSEFGNLKQVANDVFGEDNYVGTVVWAAGRKNDSKFLSTSHEYVLCFARSMARLKATQTTWKVKKSGLDAIYAEAERLVKTNDHDFDAASQALRKWFKNLPESSESKRHKHYSRIDEAGVFFADNISWPGGGGPTYEVLHPVTNKPVKVPSSGWRFQKPVIEEHINNGRVLFGDDETSVPTFKRYLHETEYEALYSVLYQDGRAATKRLTTLMGKKVFDYPKDENVIHTLLTLVADPDSFVLDFFAGSGVLWIFRTSCFESLPG